MLEAYANALKVKAESVHESVSVKGAYSGGVRVWDGCRTLLKACSQRVRMKVQDCSEVCIYQEAYCFTASETRLGYHED